MEYNEIVVGLDIGTTKIAALAGKLNEHGKIEILGMGKSESTGVRRGIVAYISPTVDAIRMAIDEAESGFQIMQVNVGIAGQHIKSLQHRESMIIDNVEGEISQLDIDELKDKCRKLVMLPGEDIIDILPQEYIVDHEPDIKDPVGMAGNRLEGNFHIITGQMGAIKNIYKCVRKAELDVSDLILEPLASSEAVLSEEEKEAGVVLVDIGGGTTDVAIFQDGIIRHTAVIPFGGNIITEDIKTGCSIIRSQAEKLKIKYGSALANENQANDIIVIPGLRKESPTKEVSVKKLAGIIQARMEDIIGLVYYEIKNSGLEDHLIGGIVITGGGAQLKHIAQLFEFETGMDTRIGYPTEYLSNGMEEVTSPMFATGIGLVIRGLQNMQLKEQQVKNPNFLSKAGSNLINNILNKSLEWFERDLENDK